MHQSFSSLILTLNILIIVGCATSMTPIQFNEHFQKATNSKSYNRVVADDVLSKGDCVLLVENRKYTSPMGFTIYGDVENGAIGVDEWVKADGGNAYTINNFEWVSVPAGDESATQLIVYFNTMSCK